MNERRRFLQVLAGSAVVAGAGCVPTATTTSSSSSSSSGTGGAGGAGGGTSSTGSGCTANPTGSNIGLPSDFPTGLHILANKGVIIGRDAGGLFVLSAICTHSSCDMSSTGPTGSFGLVCDATQPGCTPSEAGDVMCLCHGSIFASSGAVVRGPAMIPLTPLLLTLGCDGALYVNRGKPVSNTARVVA